MVYKIEMSSDAEGDLKNLDKQDYFRLKKKILWFSVQENPLIWSEPLTGLKNQYRWRVGKWRIIFKKNPVTNELTILWILAIKKRDKVYKNLS